MNIIIQESYLTRAYCLNVQALFFNKIIARHKIRPSNVKEMRYISLRTY